MAHEFEGPRQQGGIRGRIGNVRVRLWKGIGLPTMLLQQVDTERPHEVRVVPFTLRKIARELRSIHTFNGGEVAVQGGIVEDGDGCEKYYADDIR